MSFKDDAFEKLAQNIIKNLEKRNMEGYYFKDSASCVKSILEMMPKGSTLSWGGSQTLVETGLMDAIHCGDYNLIDRTTASSPQESRILYSQAVLADYYFMSTNAITQDGILVNIDGNGNRVACLIQGPSNVFLLVGRNKVAASLDSAIERARNDASPANNIRLSKKTPCTITGSCQNCLSLESICNQFVITRRSGHAGRIKVFLINEDLGY